MILDKLTMFDDKTALTTWIVGNNLSVFSYDTMPTGVPAAVGGVGGTFGGGPIGGPLLHDIGRGKPVFLFGQIGTTATSAGAPTLQANFVQADNGPLTTNLVSIMLTAAAIPLATLVAGYRLPFKTIPGKISKEFIGIQWIVGTAVYTGGTVSAGMSLAPFDDHADVLGVAP